MKGPPALPLLREGPCAGPAQVQMRGTLGPEGTSQRSAKELGSFGRAEGEPGTVAEVTYPGTRTRTERNAQCAPHGISQG